MKLKLTVIGVAYYRNGDRMAALATLNKALKIQRDFPGAEKTRRILAEIKK